MFKMRELRGRGLVAVRWIPTDDNTADRWTKILDRQPFEKFRRLVLNLEKETGNVEWPSLLRPPGYMSEMAEGPGGHSLGRFMSTTNIL